MREEDVTLSEEGAAVNVGAERHGAEVAAADQKTAC